MVVLFREKALEMAQDFCGKCGNAVQPKDRFCRKCGSPLDSTREFVLELKELGLSNDAIVMQLIERGVDENQATTIASFLADSKLENRVGKNNKWGIISVGLGILSIFGPVFLFLSFLILPNSEVIYIVPATIFFTIISFISSLIGMICGIIGKYNKEPDMRWARRGLTLNIILFGVLCLTALIIGVLYWYWYAAVN